MVDLSIVDAVALEITNSGVDDITIPFDIRLYVSFDDNITISDEQAAIVTVDSIAAGDTLVIIFPSIILPDAPVAYKVEAAPGPVAFSWGDAFIGPFIDPGNVIAESNETDNTTSQAIYIDDDTDGDGVLDSADDCPFYNPGPFDADGDGCPDAGRGGRHVEYDRLMICQ